MKKVFRWLAAALLAAGPGALAADIVGTVTLIGTPPPEEDIGPTMTQMAPDCAAMYDPDKMPTTHFYVVGPKGQFADVVVSLQGITGKSTGPSASPAVLDQKGCLYSPQILAIQTGQKLTVRNSDTCVHNVHCIPTVPGNQERNDVQMPGGPDLTYTFPKPEEFIKFECNIHPWMKAWVSVFDSPYFAVSGTDGKFIIKNVPPGKYTVEADHRKLGSQTQSIEVADKDVTVNFTYQIK